MCLFVGEKYYQVKSIEKNIVCIDELQLRENRTYKKE